MRLTGNPGGPGHQWVKARYIDPAPMGWQPIRDPETGLDRVYIPSRVTDNQYLGAGYIGQPTPIRKCRAGQGMAGR